MADDELKLKRREVEANITESGSRIRRYTLDPFLREPDDPKDPDPGKGLREKCDSAWETWADLRKALNENKDCDAAALAVFEDQWVRLDRKIDLIQRELISDESRVRGVKTLLWLAVSLVLLSVAYLASHGLPYGDFEPWPEWGPLKYGEVAFWSSFGVLCWLIFLAAMYLARRDFDPWYQGWYIATALRAPFMTVILMLVILEATEWAGEDTFIQKYLLAEGNKFYFIALTSFCLGLTSDTANQIMRTLADGIGNFVKRTVQRFCRRIGPDEAGSSSSRA